jgi:hypothetical protein
MALRITIEPNPGDKAVQAFDSMEAIKESLGYAKILSNAPFANSEIIEPVPIERILRGESQPLFNVIDWEDL